MVIVTVDQYHPLLQTISIIWLCCLRNKMSVCDESSCLLLRSTERSGFILPIAFSPPSYLAMTPMKNGSFSQTHFLLRLEKLQKLVPEEL